MSGKILFPDFGAAHAHFSRKIKHAGYFIQGSKGFVLVGGQYIHQIQMTIMKTIQIIVPAKSLLTIPCFPVGWGGYTMQEGAIMQNGQIKTTAIPAYQYRGVFIEPCKKTG